MSAALIPTHNPMKIQSKALSCPLCGSDESLFTEKLKIENLSINSCRCTMTFLNAGKSPDFSTARKGLRSQSYVRILEDINKRTSLIYSKITKKMRTSGKKLLNVNSDPKFVQLAKDRNWEIEELNINAVNENSVQIKDDYYDYITLLDVLQYTSRPAQILNQCFTALKSGGHIVISVPNEASIFTKMGRTFSGFFKFTYKETEAVYFNLDTLCSLVRHFECSMEKIYFDRSNLGTVQANPLLKVFLNLVLFFAVPLQLSDRLIMVIRKKVDVGH